MIGGGARIADSKIGKRIQINDPVGTAGANQAVETPTRSVASQVLRFLLAWMSLKESTGNRSANSSNR